MRFSRHRTGRRGASMVEMALILPLLITLVFGVMEYGWMFMRISQVNNAARHGARVAARPDVTTKSQVDAAVAEMMQQAGFDDDAYTVSATSLSILPPGPVTVTVVLPYKNQNTLIGFALLPVPDSLTGRAAMAKEGPGG